MATRIVTEIIIEDCEAVISGLTEWIIDACALDAVQNHANIEKVLKEFFLGSQRWQDF